MSEQDRTRWTQRYAEGSYAGRSHPSRLLEQELAEIRCHHTAGPMPRALDLACGRGRNALFLAGQGYQVDAIDIASNALTAASETAGQETGNIRWIEHDLDQGLPETYTDYDLVLVVRYLDLALLRLASDRLRPGGSLLCEVHLQTDQEVAGPGNSDFRVPPGALREAVRGLAIQYEEEGLVTDPDGRRVALARIIARRPA